MIPKKTKKIKSAIPPARAWEPVSSSNLSAFRYNGKLKQLDVLFASGAAYRYLDVPQSEVGAFRSAPSKGSYFHKHIRNTYPFAPLSAAEAL